MDLTKLFLQRYNVLYDSFLGGILEKVPDNLMRKRPNPRVNSIAWIFWHLTRVEDAGLNRFVVDRPQVLDGGNWMQRLNLPWRDHGSGMTFAEVDALSQLINLQALRDYSRTVHLRTLDILKQIDQVDLDTLLQEERVRMVVIDEGLAHSNPEGFIKNYTGWSKGKCLLTYGLTHPFQHVGEMEVIASLLGVDF